MNGHCVIGFLLWVVHREGETWNQGRLGFRRGGKEIAEDLCTWTTGSSDLNGFSYLGSMATHQTVACMRP